MLIGPIRPSFIWDFKAPSVTFLIAYKAHIYFKMELPLFTV